MCEKTKICSKCLKKKKTEKFRTRLDKRDGRVFLNNTCRACDILIQREYYLKHKDTQQFKEKTREQGREYRKKNRAVYLQRQKKRRADPKYQAYMKKYREKNKERIKELHKPRSKEWAQKQIDNITEQYVLAQLCHPRTGISRKVAKKNPEVINFYQSHIKFKRLCKTLNS